MKKKVLNLRPTQVCLGLKDVEDKVKKIKRMTLKNRNKHQQLKSVPVVLGPNKEVYMIDHHHYVRACWELGIEHVNVKVVADFSKMRTPLFWQMMKDNEWVYTYNQYGEAVNFYFHLPDNVKGMADDPYRSIAWMVREAGGFAKTDVPFSEFYWAELFRTNMIKHPRSDGYEACVKEAMKLCKWKLAAGLPGYKGKT